MYKNYIKRILDVVISLICIVVLIPFYIVSGITKDGAAGFVFSGTNRKGRKNVSAV